MKDHFQISRDALALLDNLDKQANGLYFKIVKATVHSDILFADELCKIADLSPEVLADTVEALSNADLLKVLPELKAYRLNLQMGYWDRGPTYLMRCTLKPAL